MSGNIYFFLDEEEESIQNFNDDPFDLNEILQQIEDSEAINDDLTAPNIINYNENYTVKDLQLICDYYGFAKEIKNNKYNKEEIIHFLVEFENNPMNNLIVSKRQNLWFYINELKNDKFMKKYVLW